MILKKIAAIVMVAVAVCGFAMTPAFAANSDDNACQNYPPEMRNDPNYQALCSGEGEDEVKVRVQNILNTIFLWSGIIAVIVILIGAYFYISSQGNTDKLKKAKEAIMYAVIGLIVIASAFAIVNFTLGAV